MKGSNMPTKTQHMPLPWALNREEKHPWVIEAPSNIPGIPAIIVKIGYRPNAAFIIRAVNAYDELLQALLNAHGIIDSANPNEHDGALYCKCETAMAYRKHLKVEGR